MASLGNIPSLHISTFYRPSLQTLSTTSTPTLSFFSQSKPLCLNFGPASLSLRTRTKLRSTVLTSALKSLSEIEPVIVSEESEDISQQFPSETGVYAVYDSSGVLQFIGISRNVAASIQTHRKSVPELCCSVKVLVIEEPDRTALTEAWKSWMEEHIKSTGKVPAGNESGNATWVKQAPRRKADLRLMPGRGTKLSVPLEELIGKVVKENRVVAFIKGSRSAPQCGFSQKVVGILNAEGVDYESLDVLDEDHNSGLRDALKKFSNWPTFPQVFLDGELLGGCDILTSMHESGELTGLLKK